MRTSISKKLLAGALSVMMVLSLVAPTGAQAAKKPYTVTGYKTVKAGVERTYTIKGVKKSQYVKVQKNVSGETVKYNGKKLKDSTKVQGTGKNLTLKVTFKEKKVNYTAKFTVRVYNKKSGKIAKNGKIVKTVKVKTQIKKDVAVTGVVLDNATPKAGDIITVKTEPANATNVASYAWFSGDTAENTVNAITGQTTKSLEVTSDLVGKFVKVVVTDADGKTFEATTTAAVAAKEGTLTVTQKGANTIVAVASVELAATDKVVLKKGSTEQTISAALGEDKKTVTITTSTKIAADDYNVVITPTNTGIKELTGSFKGEAERLAGLKIGKELCLVSATDFKTVQTTITGSNQWEEDFNLGSGTVQVYPSVAASDVPNSIDKVGTFTTGYDSTKKTYTLVKDGSIPFQLGDKVNLTAIYTSGSTVIQQTAELVVSNVPYVATMEFGELTTTNAKLAGKKVVVSNFNKGSYYIPVVAKDQYGNKLDADALNAKVTAQSLFINPTSETGAYGGFDAAEGFTTLDDGTIAMNVNGSGKNLPGEATITVAGIGGLSTTTKFVVEDDPYIATMNVAFPGSMYQKTEAEFTVEATNQYGEAVNLYDQKITKISATKIYFGDLNTLTRDGSYIEVSSGALDFAKNSAKKSVTFTYTPAPAATNAVVTITTATPKVETKTLTIGKVGTPASIKKELYLYNKNSVSLTAGKAFDFTDYILFVDTNGEIVTGEPVVEPVFSPVEVSTTEANDGTKETLGDILDADADGYYWTLAEKNGALDADGEVTADKTKTYVATLYYVKDADGVAKLLDTKEFKVIVAAANETGTKYESYTAAVKAGGELLANWAGSGDSTTIVVKGTDANNVTATLTEGVDYVLTVDNGLTVAGTKIEPGTGSVQGTDANPVAGEATVTVWDVQSGEEVASVKVAYSNANPKATEWSITKQRDDDGDLTDATLNGSGNYDSNVTSDTIDLAYGSHYFAKATEGAVKFVNNGAGPAYTSYLAECIDQYGLRYEKAVWSVNGTKIVESGAADGDKELVNTTADTKKYTFQGTAAGLETINFYVIVGFDAAAAAAYADAEAALSGLTKTAVQSDAVELEGTKTVADAIAVIKTNVLANVKTESGITGLTSSNLTFSAWSKADATALTTSAEAITYTVKVTYNGYTKTITDCSTTAKDAD